jgi:TIR domain
LADGHIFVSYSSADGAIADELVRQLEVEGSRIWYAPRDVRPGTDYSEQIQSAIEQASAFVVIVSKDSNESDFVRAETEMAFSRRRPIFPVRYSRVMPAPGMALFLQLRHWTDAFGSSRHNAISRLGRELAGIGKRGERGAKSRFARSPDRAETRSLSPAMIALAALGSGALLLFVILIVQPDSGSAPNATAATPDSVSATDSAVSGSGAPVASGGQPDMAPLVATWLRHIQDTAPPPIEEMYYTDNATTSDNMTVPANDATTITNAANSAVGM